MKVATRAFDPNYFLDKNIDKALTEYLHDDETLRANGRDVVIAHNIGEDGHVEIWYNILERWNNIVKKANFIRYQWEFV